MITLGQWTEMGASLCGHTMPLHILLSFWLVTSNAQDSSCFISQGLWENAGTGSVTMHTTMGMQSEQKMHISHCKSLRLWDHLLLRYDWSFLTATEGIIFPWFKNYFSNACRRGLLTIIWINIISSSTTLSKIWKQGKNIRYWNNVNFYLILSS